MRMTQRQFDIAWPGLAPHRSATSHRWLNEAPPRLPGRISTIPRAWAATALTIDEIAKRTPLNSVQIARGLAECDRRGLAGADRAVPAECVGQARACGELGGNRHEWLKLHAEICTDPKIRLLAFGDRWHYVALLCAKADGLLDDDSPIRERLIRVHLGLAEVEAESLKKRPREVA